MNDWTHRKLRPTQDLPEPDDETPPEQPRASRGGLIRGVAGVFVCVLLIMAVGLVVAQLVSAHNHQPGPGGLSIGAHVLGAIAGVVGYRYTRRTGLARLFGLLAVLLITVLLLWFFWWSPNL